MRLPHAFIVLAGILVAFLLACNAATEKPSQLGLIQTPRVVAVGDEFSLQLLEINEDGSFVVQSEGVEWTATPSSRIQIAGDSASAIAPGKATIMVGTEGEGARTDVLLYSGQCLVDGDLSDWREDELTRISEGSAAIPKIETNYPSGEWRRIPLSEGQLLEAPEFLVIRRMGVRYTELAIDIAVELEGSWAQDVGIWVDLVSQDERLSRILAIPDMEIARPIDDEILGTLSEACLAFGTRAFEIRIPWRDLALTGDVAGTLQSVVVRFHADVLSDQGVWLREILTYELPASDISAIALQSGAQSAGAIAASQLVPAPGDLVTVSANYVDAFGRLWLYEPGEYRATENCEATNHGVRPMSDGDVLFSVDVWPEPIHIVARGLRRYDTSLLFPCQVTDSMPVAVEWQSEVAGARFAWFAGWPDQTEVLSYTGLWQTNAAFTHIYASNRRPLKCSVLVMSQDGTTRWLANECAKTFAVGDRILLDGSLFNNEGAHSWEQNYGERNSMEYVTQNVAELLREGDSTSFTPEWPGIYRFRLGTDVVDVRVDAPDSMCPILRSVLMYDYFGDWDSNHVFGADRLEWAAEYASSLGANAIAVMNCAAYESWNPLPSLQRMPERAVLDEWEIELLSRESWEAGLGMMLFEQQYSMLEAPRGTWNEIWPFIYSTQSQEWYDAWFEGYTEYMLEEALIAEAYGVEYLLLSWGTTGAIFRQTEQWRQIIADIRHVYSGEIGTYMRPHSMEDVHFLEDVDFVLVAVDSLDKVDYEAPTQPGVIEIREGFCAALREFESIIEAQAPDIPVYAVLTATSCDAQNDFMWAEPFPAARMDLREQVAYYEGFFEAVASVESITGVVLFGGAWFEGFDFKGDYFDTYAAHSFTGKPAEGVVRVWFGAE